MISFSDASSAGERADQAAAVLALVTLLLANSNCDIEGDSEAHAGLYFILAMAQTEIEYLGKAWEGMNQKINDLKEKAGESGAKDQSGASGQSIEGQNEGAMALGLMA
jgi:hypothetical protein